MKKGFLLVIIFFAILFLSSKTSSAATPNITDMNITPTIDISYFNNYNITANVTNSSELESVEVNVSGLNGEGVSCWEYFVNGTCENNLASTFSMSYDSETIWKKTAIRPDHIYPQIEFDSDSVFWYNSPQNISLNRFNYHLFHFTNNFSIISNTSFWIEFASTPEDTSKSKDLLVYLVERNHDISYFQSNWKSDEGAELVGSRTKSDSLHHSHTANSSHHLIKISANDDRTVGSKNLNITGDFWVVLFSEGTSGRAWNLQYREDSLCNNTDRWYIGSQSGWTTTSQSGCPDSHIHLARRTTYLDGANITVSANYSNGTSFTNTSSFYFGTLPNFGPTPTGFTHPINETYGGFINITWAATLDPNGDSVTYNLPY